MTDQKVRYRRVPHEEGCSALDQFHRALNRLGACIEGVECPARDGNSTYKRWDRGDCSWAFMAGEQTVYLITTPTLGWCACGVQGIVTAQTRSAAANDWLENYGPNMNRRIGQMDIPGKVATVKAAFTKMVAECELTGIDATAAAIIASALETGNDDMDTEVIDSSRLLCVGAFVGYLLVDARDGQCRSATDDAVNAIGAMARRVNRTNPALAKELWSMGQR